MTRRMRGTARDGKGGASERWLQWLLWALSIAGACMSFRIAINAFPINADLADVPALWMGVHDYGFGFLKSWSYTPDSWLLTIVPLDFLLFDLLGDDPRIPVYGGVACFVLAAFACKVIVDRVANVPSGALRQKLPGLICMCLLLFLGSYAHFFGYASFGVSHNSSNLLGIIGLILVLRHALLGRVAALCGYVLIGVAAAVSDPWYIAAYAIPGVVVCGCFVLIDGARRRRWLMLMVASAAIIVAERSKLFGLFYFVPAFSFETASRSMIRDNAIWALKALGGFFNFLPWSDGCRLRYSLVNLAILAAGGVLIFRVRPSFPLSSDGESPTPDIGKYPRKFVLMFCAVSIAATLSAMVLSDVPGSPTSGRYVINVVYMAVVAATLAFASVWRMLGSKARVFVVLMAASFMCAGVTTAHVYWAGGANDVDTRAVQARIDVLNSYGLHHGFGSYWGTDANAVSWLSHGKVAIRPVIFDSNAETGRLAGPHFQSSSFWYDLDDPRRGKGPSFVILNEGYEACQNVPACVSGLVQQYGQPSRVISAVDMPGWIILVWPYDILDYVQPIALKVGDSLELTASGVRQALPGFGAAEAWGTWTVGKRAHLVLRTHLEKDVLYQLKVDAMAFTGRAVPYQSVCIYINRIESGCAQFTDAGFQQSVFFIPSSIVEAGEADLNVELRIAHPISPSEAGKGNDPRHLGLGVRSLMIEALNGSDAKR